MSGFKRVRDLRKALESAKIKSRKDFLEYKNRVLPRIKTKEIKKDFMSNSKSIFIGEFGYPDVNVGVLSTQEYNHNEDIKYWKSNNWKISKIANARLDLINSKKINNVKKLRESKFMGQIQEVAQASKIVDLEVNLEKEPGANVSISKFHKPIGPSAALQKFSITENVRVPSAVDRVVSDNDLKSQFGLNKLYQKGHDVDYLSQILSSGSLGELNNRKIVPTKWSITATDDTIGKNLIKEIKDFDITGNLVFTGNYMGNYFIILLVEGNFEYELFEFFRDSSEYMTDYENNLGRKNYAKNTTGGYYAARLGICEKLKAMKRQAKIIEFRFITDEYYLPLGVWVVREAVRNTAKSKPIEFGSKELMINYAKIVAKKKFGHDLDVAFKKSKVLESKKQKNIKEFF